MQVTAKVRTNKQVHANHVHAHMLQTSYSSQFRVRYGNPHVSASLSRERRRVAKIQGKRQCNLTYKFARWPTDACESGSAARKQHAIIHMCPMNKM